LDTTEAGVTVAPVPRLGAWINDDAALAVASSPAPGREGVALGASVTAEAAGAAAWSLGEAEGASVAAEAAEAAADSCAVAAGASVAAEAGEAAGTGGIRSWTS
jgi:hypothetical protein